MRTRSSAVLAAALLLAACPSTGPSGSDGSTPGPNDAAAPSADAAGPADASETSLDAGSAEPDAAQPAGPDAAAAGLDAATITHECEAGAGWCTGALSRHACVDTALGRRWADEACAAGSGCVAGACVAGACTDECALGEAKAGKTCGLVDVATGAAAAADPAGSLHDRARAYEAWLRKNGLTAGGVGTPVWADPPARTSITWVDGLGDSAIWTGTWLAAEALRLKATGEPDARETVKSIVGTLHDWLNVSGTPGMLARFAVRQDAYPAYTMGDLTGRCGQRGVHCGVPYRGAAWDYVGHISRDQYQGVVLGYALAYEALGAQDEATRELIRGDVVALVKELMKERQLKMKVTVNGTAVPWPVTVTVRFVVLAPAEAGSGGDVEFLVDTARPEEADMWGFQEFTPDLADLLHQVPGFSWLPPVERASSAVMLASFFQVALKVTEGVPGREADRAAILDYYLNHSGPGGNVDDWLEVAAGWSDGLSSDPCGGHYYSNNITFEPLYDLGRLEWDPARKARVAEELLGGKLWPVFRSHKNVFFSFIYAGLHPSPEATAVPDALAQLAQFPPPPRVAVPVDLRSDARYQPHDGSCADQVDHSTAVDVGERPTSDFLWQRHPWGLYDGGDPARTWPGVDYLVGYWMGRAHGFVAADDAAGKCLAWQ